jgi:protein-S-isoprenylcysteine O-methyltransferase Ste14
MAIAANALQRASNQNAVLSGVVDVFERVLAIGLFLFLWMRLSSGIYAGDRIYQAIIVVELTILFFVVFRKLASTLSLSRRDWFVAGLGTCLPTLVVPGTHAPLVPEMISQFLIVAGFVIQLHGKLVLNRSFGIIAANRGVKTAGPYVLVRHPIYLGYTITHVGFVLYAPHWWNASVYIVTLIFQILRIVAEERLLLNDFAYSEYSHRVRYRLIPGVF